mmetsp:Transcript_11626/g.11660  ORF Transcript_11626/g.11660 Transcript_11626/m.11660 type:complete len:81 (+) Transcript_11626:225-467(+)
MHCRIRPLILPYHYALRSLWIQTFLRTNNIRTPTALIFYKSNVSLPFNLLQRIKRHHFAMKATAMVVSSTLSPPDRTQRL